MRLRVARGLRWQRSGLREGFFSVRIVEAYISGTARAVRVEETGESHAGRSGVGALIGKYQIRRVDSVNPKRMRAFGTNLPHYA